jgi:hypothetical protein
MLAVEQNEAISHKPSACAIVLSQYLPRWARHGQHCLVRSQLGDCSDERYFSSRQNKYYARHTVFYVKPLEHMAERFILNAFHICIPENGCCCRLGAWKFRKWMKVKIADDLVDGKGHSANQSNTRCRDD